MTWRRLPEEQQTGRRVKYEVRTSPTSGMPRNISYITELGIDVYLDLLRDDD